MNAIGWKMDKRRRSLAIALGLTLGAVAWVAAQDDAGDGDAAVAVAPRRADTSANATVQAERTAPARNATSAPWPAPPAARREPAEPPAGAAWGLPPPPPAPPLPVRIAAAPSAAPPAAPPQAPAFPYTWIGRVDDGAQPQVLLDGPTRTLSVKPQDVIDGQWRVEAVDAQGLRLTWLPTGQPVQVSRPVS